MTAALASLMDQVHTASGRVVVIATTNQIDSVEPSLRRPGRFGKQVDVPVPSAGARKEVYKRVGLWTRCVIAIVLFQILDVLLRNMAHSLTEGEVSR